MPHPIHDAVVAVVEDAISLMDEFMRDHIELPEYSKRLNALDVESILVRFEADFRNDVSLVYYLDALMILSSLQHELDFQVAEYGGNVASEDIKMLRELLAKFGRVPATGVDEI